MLPLHSFGHAAVTTTSACLTLFSRNLGVYGRLPATVTMSSKCFRRARPVLHVAASSPPEIDQFCNGDLSQMVLEGERSKIVLGKLGGILVDNGADRRAGKQARKSRQIDGCFGAGRPRQHTTLTSRMGRTWPGREKPIWGAVRSTRSRNVAASAFSSRSCVRVDPATGVGGAELSWSVPRRGSSLSLPGHQRQISGGSVENDDVDPGRLHPAVVSVRRGLRDGSRPSGRPDSEPPCRR